jgi:hypothetical protein
MECFYDFPFADTEFFHFQVVQRPKQPWILQTKDVKGAQGSGFSKKFCSISNYFLFK